MSTAAAGGHITNRLSGLVKDLSETVDNFKKNRLLQELIDLSRVVTISTLRPFRAALETLRVLCWDREKVIRTQCLRALRYLITDQISVETMLAMNLDLFVVRTLERPNQKEYKVERVQALKIVIRLIEISPKDIPRSMVQSMVLIMSRPKDDLRRVCLDRVRELAFLNPKIVASSNGIHAMVEAILDKTCADMAGQLTMTLLYLFDQEHTRRHIRPAIHIQHMLSVFTDTETPETQEKEQRRVASHKALMIIMRSWTGIFILASDQQGLKSLVEILSLPSTVKGSSWSKDAVFMLLLNILNVVKSEDLATHKSKGIWKNMGPNLLHSYVVMVLLAFIEAGLVPILAEIGMQHGQEMSGVATNLLREILHLSADLLPSDPWGAQLNALPSVINRAASVDSKRVVSRVLARDMLKNMSMGGNIETMGSSSSHHHHQHRGSLSPRHSLVQHDTKDGGRRMFPDFNLFADLASRERAESTDLRAAYRPLVHGIDVEAVAMLSDSAPVARSIGRKQHSTPRIVTARHASSGGQMITMHRRITTSSESIVDKLMLESGVLENREHTGWDWEKCLYLLEGPLANPQIILNTKFAKRLLTFIRPSRQQAFATMPWTLQNMKCVKVACQLFRVLCSSKEACESKLFQDCVREILDELVAEATRGVGNNSQRSSQSMISGDSSSTSGSRRLRPFSRESVTERLAREYFTLLSIVTASVNGAEVVRTCTMPKSFYEGLYTLYKDESRDYLARLILSCFSYGNHNKNQRTLLDMWVKSGSVNLRKYAVAHLRVLLRDKSLDVLSHFWQWGVRLLASQLGHENEELALSALSVLEEVCKDDKCLEYLIKYGKPRFMQIGAAANNLQSKFLSKKSGVQYLQQIDWIEPQMQLWMAEGNQKYVEAVENALVGAFDTGMHIPKVVNTRGGSAGRVVDPSSSGGSTAAPAHVSGPTTTAEKKRRPEYGYGFGGIHCTIRTEYDDYFFQRIHRLPWKVSISLEYSNRSQYILLGEAFVHTVPHIANTVYRNRGEHGSSAKGGSSSSGLSSSSSSSSSHYSSTHSPSGLQRGGSGMAGGDYSEEMMMAETPNGLETYVACVVISPDGKPRPQKLDQGVTIRASLSVGKEKNSSGGQSSSSLARRYEQVCTSKDRKMLVDCKNGQYYLETKTARWNFVRGKTGPVSMPASISKQSSTIRKRSVIKALGESKADLYLISVWFKIPTPNSSNPVVVLAPHFFGELAKTEEGCAIIRNSGHLDMFVSTIANGATVVNTETRSQQQQQQQQEYTSPSSSSGAAGGELEGGVQLKLRKKPRNLLQSPTTTTTTTSTATTSNGGDGEGEELGGGKCAVTVEEVEDDDDNDDAEKKKKKKNKEDPKAAAETASSRAGAAGEGGVDSKAAARSKKNANDVNLQQHNKTSALKIRTALWAVGQIGSSETGFRLLQEQKEDVIGMISDMALECPTLSMRGTCFYIMGLLSRTPSARTMLSRLGWRFSPNIDVGIVIPMDTRRFLSVKECGYHGSWAQDPANNFGLEYIPIKNAPLPQTTLKPDYSNCKQVILGHISNLCNNVTIKPSLSALRALRKDKKAKSYFTSAEMLYYTFRIVTSYNFQLEARRCLFDEVFNEVVVTKETLRVFDTPFSESARPSVAETSGKQRESKMAGGEQGGSSSTKKKKTNATATTDDNTKKNNQAKGASVTKKPLRRVVGFSFNDSTTPEAVTSNTDL